MGNDIFTICFSDSGQIEVKADGYWVEDQTMLVFYEDKTDESNLIDKEFIVAFPVCKIKAIWVRDA